jgi:tyrosine-protein phosphatase YwqE
VADGVTQVVCTPHVFPGRFENRRSSIAEDFQRFAELVLKRAGCRCNCCGPARCG